MSGAAVRYRLYAHWGLTPLQIAKTVAFCSLTFGLGGMVLGGAILFLEPRAVPFFGAHLPPRGDVRASARCCGRSSLGYVTFARVLRRVRLFGQTIELPGMRMAVLQVMLATVDVAITATIFYQLLPTVAAPDLDDLPRRLRRLLHRRPAANLPGRHRRVRHRHAARACTPYVDAPRIVGAIVVFRLYYYVIPLFLAGSLFAGNEILLRGGMLWQRAATLPAVQAIARWSEPDFAVASSTGSVALCGVLLLCLGVLAPQTDFSWLDPDFAGLASPGRPVRAVADRRRPGGDGDRPVASGQPGLGTDAPAAGGRRRLRRHAGRPALGRRRAGADRAAGRAVPRLLLSPRQLAQRSVGGVHARSP